jgi:hypothetical protein
MITGVERQAFVPIVGLAVVKPKSVSIDVRENYVIVNYTCETKDFGDRRISFFLRDESQESKEFGEDGLKKKKYINSAGVCSWASSEENLPEWFRMRDYRLAKVGEEGLVNFLRVSLQFDFRLKESAIFLDTKRLFAGDASELEDAIPMMKPVICLFSVYNSTTTDDFGNEIVVQRNDVFTGAFLPPSLMNTFNLIDYDKLEVINKISQKSYKSLTMVEKFVLAARSAYGAKGVFFFKPAREYVPDMVNESVIDYEEGVPEY